MRSLVLLLMVVGASAKSLDGLYTFWHTMEAELIVAWNKLETAKQLGALTPAIEEKFVELAEAIHGVSESKKSESVEAEGIQDKSFALRDALKSRIAEVKGPALSPLRQASTLISNMVREMIVYASANGLRARVPADHPIVKPINEYLKNFKKVPGANL